MTKKIAVIGGGISGLSTAYFLEKYAENNWSVELFEATNRVGGWIKTEPLQDFLLELGPHTLRLQKERKALDQLCTTLMLDQEKTFSPKSLCKYIQFEGQMHAFPESIVACIKSPLLKHLKLPILQALFYTRKKHTIASLSVGDFFSTRFGKEFVNRLIDPICRGIWASSPYELSLEKCFPSLAEWDKKNLPLIFFLCKKAFSSLGKQKSSIYSFSKGLELLPKKLEEKIKGKIHLQSPVLQIRGLKEKIAVVTSQEAQEFDHVITTLPSFSLASLLEDSFIEEKRLCKKPLYKSLCIVHLGWQEESFQKKGFGILTSSCEEKELLGSIWTSSIFAKHSPREKSVFLTYLFKGLEKEGSDKSHFLQKAKEHAKKKLMIQSAPDIESEFFAKKAIYCPSPKMEQNLSMLQHLLAVKLPQLTLSGTFLSGVSIYDCVDYAKKTAICIAKKNRGHLT